MGAYVEVGRLEGSLQDAGLAEVERRAARRGVVLRRPAPRAGLPCGHPARAAFTDENGVRICAACTWPGASPERVEALAALALELRKARGLDEEE